MIKLDLEALNKVLPATTKDDCRYYLEGIHIEDKDGFRYYTATDGHILLSVKTEIEEDSLDKAYTLKIESQIKSRFELFDMIVVDDTTVVLKADKKVAVDIIDCNYPDWERVVPDDSEGLASKYCMFPPKCIEKLNKFIDDAYLTRPIQADEHSAAKWTKEEGNKEFTAVIMPVNIK